MLRTKLGRFLTVLYVAGIVLYVLLAILYPADKATISSFGVTREQAEIISLSVAVPLSLIWLIAIMGYITLRNYSHTIFGQADGRAFTLLSVGCLFLAIQSPIRVLSGYGLRYFVDMYPHLQTFSTVFSNYLSLVLFAVAFIYISRGAHALADIVDLRPRLLTYHAIILIFTAVGVVYCLSLFRPNSLEIFTAFSNLNDYHLPPAVTVLTMAIPSLYLWFISLFAAYEIFSYQQQVKGLLYRQALRLLSVGIGIVTIDAVLLQFITLSTAKFNKLGLSSLLIAAYVVLVIMAIGFVMITRGARRLQKLEEI